MISHLAFIHPTAKIGQNVDIAPFAYIDEGVVIGDNCQIRPHASILAGSIIGNDCKIYEGAVVGATPQDFRWKGEMSNVVIGEKCTIREYVIINRSINPGGATVIGRKTFVMAQTHIGHDSEIGSKVVIGNAVRIAGDCKVSDYVVLSSNSLLHENCEVGRYVLVKGGCRVNGHVPPYIVLAHNPAEFYGVNTMILRYHKFPEDVIEDIKKMYHSIYRNHTSIINSTRRIREDIADSEHRSEVLDFIRNHNNHIIAVPVDVMDD